MGFKTKFIKITIPTLATLLFVCFDLQTAFAGNIKEVQKDAKCEFLFEGPIQPGDLAKISKARETLFNPYRDESGGEVADVRNICLNSPGGNLEEAIAIGDYFYKNGIGTRVDQSHECLSACAFAFMMGVARGGEEALLNRTMHPTAKLGFHKPSIDVPKISGLTDRELESAFEGAIDITASLVELTIRQIPETQRPMMKADLIAESFRRKGSDFFFIDTVAKAGRWEINLTDVQPQIKSINPEIAQNICFNLWSWTSKNFSERGRASDKFPLADVEILQGANSALTYAWGQGGVSNSDGLCSAGISTKYHAGAIVICSEAFSPIARFTGRNCSQPDQRMSAMEYLPLDSIAFPPNLKIEAIPAFNFQKDIKTQNLHRRKLKCSVLSNGIKIDSEECYREIRQGSEQQEIYVFYWPSGGKTVVETNFGGTKFQVNGNSAQLSSVSGYNRCYLNSKSGNHFCID